MTSVDSGSYKFINSLNFLEQGHFLEIEETMLGKVWVISV